VFDWLNHRAKREQEIQEEIEYHLEKLAEEETSQGTPPLEARFFARRKLGNPTLARERIREVWIWPAIERFVQDLRYAIRGLRKHPAFTLAAVFSLALGIGANTAIFSLIDALLLRMLPVPESQRLLQLINIQAGRRVDSFSYPAIKALEQRANLFSGICGFSGAMFNAGPPGAVQSTPGAWVTGTYYETLGIEPAAGRLLNSQDDRPGGGLAGPVAVLSFSYWESKYHRDPNVIGKALLIEGVPVAVVGVSPRGFEGANVGRMAAITLPLAGLPQIFPERQNALQPSREWLRALARPKPAVSAEQARAQLAVLWADITRELIGSIKSAVRRKVILKSTIDLVPGGTGWTSLRQTFTRPLMVLMAIVALVLLVACVNVANLLLTRAAARSREIGIRVAIGAGRGRLMRQLLTESVLLAFLGAGVGIVLAYSSDQLLIHLFSSGHGGALLLDVHPDLRVLVFTAAVALLAGIIFGLAPAFRVTASEPGEALKLTQPGGCQRNWLASVLLISQVAFSLSLLIDAGLFVRSLENLENVDPGFRPEGVLLANLDPRRAGYKDTRLIALYRDLLQRVSQIPGVQSASLSGNTPLSGGIWSGPVLVDAQAPSRSPHASAHFNTVAPGYFATMRIRMTLGRDFSHYDNAGSEPVAIVNEEFVRTFLNAGNPLGRRVSIQDSPDWQNMQIVGVVKNTISFDLREPPPPFVYMPYFQNPKNAREATIEVRAQGSLVSVAEAVRRRIHGRLPDTALTIVPFTKQVKDSMIQERLLALLASFFGSLALVLAAVGLYGLTAYSVAQRTSEIGIRMALGATRSDVLALVLRGAFSLVAAGLLAGLPLALTGSSFISKMLFGVRPADPITAGFAAGVLLLAAMVAAYLPARRASRIDPNVALRYE
jgi:predicted permease